jgi:hypothetical protein
MNRDHIAAIAQALVAKYNLTAKDAVLCLKQLTSSAETRARLTAWMRDNLQLMAEGKTYAQSTIEVGLLLAWLIDAGDLGFTDVFKGTPRHG